LVLKKEELIKKLRETARKMEKDKSDYEIEEQLSVGRGEGNYDFYFRAKKIGGFGALRLLKDVARIAYSGLYGGVEGAIWSATYTAEREMYRRQYRSTLEPIHRKAKGNELAKLFERWANTLSQGFLETIGSDIVIDDESSISATIKPGKEIQIKINFVKLRSDIEAKKAVTESEAKVAEAVEKMEEAVKQVPSVFPTPVPVPVIPEPMKHYFMTSASALYVEGTLRNTESGFSLDLDNQFTDVGLVSPIKLTVDGVEIASDKISIKIGDKVYRNSEINLSTPLVFKKGEKATLMVDGIKLPEGPHRVDIETNIQGIGKISFTLMDEI